MKNLSCALAATAASDGAGGVGPACACGIEKQYIVCNKLQILADNINRSSGYCMQHDSSYELQKISMVFCLGFFCQPDTASFAQLVLSSLKSLLLISTTTVSRLHIRRGN